MCSEKNGKQENAACCNPEEFKGMSEIMGKCFSGENTSCDPSAMKESMKQKGCCASKTEKTETDCCG